MKCWHCREELIWQGDFNFEDYGFDGEGVVTALSCSSCEAEVEVYLATGDTVGGDRGDS